MANPFVHVELMTNDVSKAKKFYQGLFTWKLEDMPGMEYTMISVGEGTGGGMMKNPVPNMPSHWMAYVLVDDVAAATKKAKSLGVGRNRRQGCYGGGEFRLVQQLIELIELIELIGSDSNYSPLPSSCRGRPRGKGAVRRPVKVSILALNRSLPKAQALLVASRIASMSDLLNWARNSCR